jgi:hypothetical protein
MKTGVVGFAIFVGRVKRLREKSKQNFSQQEKPMIKKD